MTCILLVEDDQKLRTIVANNLTYEGFAVSGVEDGVQALTLHRAKPADLIVLDLMLPGMDGFQVLNALRGAGDFVPVLLLTARGAEADKTRLDELRAKLAELFDLREAERQDEIKRLEERLAKLKSDLEKRKSHRQDVVDRRLKELLGQDDPTRW